MNKFVKPSLYAAPEAAARKLVELAAGIEPKQDGRIFIEQINYPFLSEFKAGLDLALDRGWLKIHESGTYVRLRPSCADLFGS